MDVSHHSSHGISTYSTADTGRGLGSTRPLHTGDLVLDIPRALMVRASNVHELIGDGRVDGLSPFQRLVAFLLVATGRHGNTNGSHADWQMYIASLPRAFDSLPVYAAVVYGTFGKILRVEECLPVAVMGRAVYVCQASMCEF